MQIDNLVKGASGQALQNLNLMMGFPENMGLDNQPLFPWTYPAIFGMPWLLGLPCIVFSCNF